MWELMSNKNYSFLNELNKKIEITKNKSKNTENNINEELFVYIFVIFLSHCPSAIILNYGEKKYWLCHGGFPTGIEESSPTFKIPHKSKLISFYESNYYNDPNKSIFYENIPEQIRWSDFHDLNKTIYDTRIKIGLSKLNKFLLVNKINFIIRGHNDDYENAFLLSNDTKIANIIKQHKVIDKNPGLISYPNYPYFVLGLNNESIYDLNKDDFHKSDNMLDFSITILKMVKPHVFNSPLIFSSKKINELRAFSRSKLNKDKNFEILSQVIRVCEDVTYTNKN
jgi:hypothetical protein